MLNLQHNVVNILYTVKGMIESHLIRAEEGRFKDQSEALFHAQDVMRRIYDQANRALAITKRISLAIRAQRNSDGVTHEASVKSVWEEVVGILKRQHSLSELVVIDHISAGYPKVQCSRNDLLEIFYTLAQNAIQAMDRKGKLIIRANLQFSNGDLPLAVITISDTGPGIPEAVLSRLFEPFFTTKPLEEGNGLGLCLVKSLVKRNGGCVTVSSFQGCGTTFTLTFPVAKSKEPREEKDYAMTG